MRSPLLRKHYVFGTTKDRPPGHASTGVILGNEVVHETDTVSDFTGLRYIDASQCEYRYLVKQYAQTMNLAAAEVSVMCPGRRAPLLTLLDAGSPDGLCPNHPQHAEKPARHVDTQLYTRGASNYTQKGSPRAMLWLPDGTLNANLFDPFRNADFLLLMIKAFPAFVTDPSRCYILSHSKVKPALLSAVTGPDYDLIKKYVRVDDDPAHNHLYHFHFSLWGEVNYGMQI